jgi:hypothetical protein
MSDPVRWNGENFKSKAALAHLLGVSREIVRRYISAGYTCDDDVPPSGAPPKKCVWNGIEYASVGIAADALGITESAMTRRLNKGYTRDADLKRPGRLKKHKD